jgi:hypothetical protein
MIRERVYLSRVVRMRRSSSDYTRCYGKIKRSSSSRFTGKSCLTICHVPHASSDSDGDVRYTGKDQVRPLNAVKKQRNCHIKFASYDDEVLIIGNGNQGELRHFLFATYLTDIFTPRLAKLVPLPRSQRHGRQQGPFAPFLPLHPERC